jgi:predicted secreted protein
MLVLSQTDNDRTVSVRVGDVVRISLPENASTGYRWTIERYDDEFLEAYQPKRAIRRTPSAPVATLHSCSAQGKPAPDNSC